MSAITSKILLPEGLAILIEKINETIKDLLDRMILHSPERNHPFIGRIYKMVYNYLQNGGKRMHGLSILLAYKAVGGRLIEAILPIAAGFQLYHHYTLAHDDIYDDDKERRGKPTVHEAFRAWFSEHGNIHDNQQSWGTLHYPLFSGTAERKAAIAGLVYGKVVHAFAFEAILYASFSREQLYPVVQALNWHDLYDNVGQMRDVFHEGDFVPDIDACFRNIWLKTGKLFEVGVVCAAQIGGASQEQVAALKEWIVSSALAYQLQDDMEDIEPDSEKGIGRGIGADLRCRKPTYLLSLALQNADAVTRDILQGWVNYSIDKLTVGDVIQAIKSTGAVERCQQKVTQLIERACQVIDSTQPILDEGCIPLMKDFSRYFVSPAYWKRPLPKT